MRLRPANPRSWIRTLFKTAICLCVATVLYLEALALIPWYFARSMARSHPELRIAPHPLLDTTFANFAGAEWQPFGCVMRLPWTDVNNERNLEVFASRSFKSGIGIGFFPQGSQADGPGAIRKAAGVHSVDIDRTLGAQNMDSNFNFERASMYASPDDVRFFATREHNARAMIFLTFKLPYVRPDAPIYEIKLGETRGFQIGDPLQRPLKIILELFDKSDRRIKIFLSANKSSTVPVTQPEINSIIRSLDCGSAPLPQK
jgi:hypothetical protein